jgi:hypothetical protein
MKNNMFKICLLSVILVLLCSCSDKDGSVKNKAALPMPEKKVSNITDVKTFATPGSISNEYYFEPSISVIEGTLTTGMYYGRPNYGEDPQNDEKEYPFILKLSQPINVYEKEGEIIKSSESEVTEVQVVPMNKNDTNKVKEHLNKHIKIQGTFFHGHTGHHHTKVLISADRILN